MAKDGVGPAGRDEGEVLMMGQLLLFPVYFLTRLAPQLTAQLFLHIS